MRNEPPRPHSSITCLLATHPRFPELTRQIKHLQHILKGVERVRVHTRGTLSVQSPRRLGVPRRSPCGVPRRSVADRLHKDCNIHSFMWTPRDNLVHIEIKAWDADWLVHAIRSIVSLAGDHEVIQSVSLVVRSGVTAWLQKKQCIEGHDFRLESVVPVDDRISHRSSASLALGMSYSWQLVLLEYCWDPRRPFEKSLQRFLSATSALHRLSDSLRIICFERFGFDDFLCAFRWDYQAQSVFQVAETRFGVVILISGNGHRQCWEGESGYHSDMRLCAVGTSCDALVQARQSFLGICSEFQCSVTQPVPHCADDRLAPQEVRDFLEADEPNCHPSHVCEPFDFIVKKVPEVMIGTWVVNTILTKSGIRVLRQLGGKVLMWSLDQETASRLTDQYVSEYLCNGAFDVICSRSPEDMIRSLTRAAQGKGRGKDKESYMLASKGFGTGGTLHADSFQHIARHFHCSLAVILEWYLDDGTLLVYVAGQPTLVTALWLASSQLVLRSQECEEARDELKRAEERIESREKASEEVVSHLKWEIKNLSARAEQAEKLLQRQAPSSDSVRKMQAELEVWKNQSTGIVELHPRPCLVELTQGALRRLVPRDHHADCDRMRHVVVDRFEEVVNIQIWKQYTLKRQQIADMIRHRQDCPWVTEVAPATRTMQELFPWVDLQHGANEVLLLHGTARQNTADIVRQGFDERLTKRGLYGRGVYFTVDACKAAQYSDAGGSGCIILARVLLGHPYIADGPMQAFERPPIAEAWGFPHDSTVARPGICNGKGRGKAKSSQVHWEFVVPDSQIYPELLIHFTYQG